MIGNAEGFLEDYIHDIVIDLKEAIINNDSAKVHKYQIELDNSLCIAEGLGATVNRQEINIKIPKVEISWENE